MRFAVSLILIVFVQIAYSIPNGFVYLKDIAPDIEQDMRYASAQNFVGRPVAGYRNGTCILSRQAAIALKKAQEIALKAGYRLKVYDCYRPQRAVNDFYRWSESPSEKTYDPNYHPRVRKNRLFAKGYIARYSGHTRGSTVDLTLVRRHNPDGKAEQNQASINRCFAKTPAYLNDNSINMGTRFDCLDASAHFDYKHQTKSQFENKKRLRQIMQQAGFKPYHKEWWHFSLNQEPFPKRYFDFVVK